jgi:hypothetical protein
MQIEQLVDIYSYARVTGSSVSLTPFDEQAQKVIEHQPVKIKNEISTLYSSSEYENILRHIQKSE